MTLRRSLATILQEAFAGALARSLPCAPAELVARRRSSPRRALGRARRAGAVLSLLPLLAAFELLACSAHRYVRPRPGAQQRGTASWYGGEFHGRATSSGETFDMNGLTAAHRDLPLGTVIEVTNLGNGRQVQVRVNDRGPFVRNRILDLSFGAAKAIDMVGSGLAEVELRVISLGEADAERRLPAGMDAWAVQVGAFRERANAEALRAKLATDYPDARIEDGDDALARVYVGRFERRDAAKDLRRTLARRGLAALVVAVVGTG